MKSLKSQILLQGLLVLSWTGPVGLSAQEPPPPRRPMPPMVRATGDAKVSVRPDQAKLMIGVVSQGSSADVVAAANARQVESVLKEMRGLLGSKGTVKTLSYSLNPDRRFPKDGGKPTIVGYTAQNTVEVTVDDLDLVGKVIDAATRAGANNLEGLQFTLKDEQAAKAEALKEAARRARADADAIASALSLRVVRVLTASEGEPQQVIRPMMAMVRQGMAAESATPIEAGTIEVHAAVTLEVEVAPQ